LNNVKEILCNAKQLRNSNENFVSANLFIDLTEADATVAYEERFRRRQQRKERSLKQQ
jgi:hypothetical protein